MQQPNASCCSVCTMCVRVCIYTHLCIYLLRANVCIVLSFADVFLPKKTLFIKENVIWWLILMLETLLSVYCVSLSQKTREITQSNSNMNWLLEIPDVYLYWKRAHTHTYTSLFILYITLYIENYYVYTVELHSSYVGLFRTKFMEQFLFGVLRLMRYCCYCCLHWALSDRFWPLMFGSKLYEKHDQNQIYCANIALSKCRTFFDYNHICVYGIFRKNAQKRTTHPSQPKSLSHSVFHLTLVNANFAKKSCWVGWVGNWLI